MSKKSKCLTFLRKSRVKMLHRFLLRFSVMRVVSKVCYQDEFCECQCFVWLPQDSGVYENTARGRDLSWDLHTNTVPTRVIFFPSFDQCRITFTPSPLIPPFPSGVTCLSRSSTFSPSPASSLLFFNIYLPPHGTSCLYLTWSSLLSCQFLSRWTVQ